MREIKFKAWDKELRVMWEMWVTEEGYFMFHPDHRGTTIYDFYRGLGEVLMDTDRFTPLQYTGIKDKNGKEIYEGDVVNVIDLGQEEWSHGEVVFEKGCFWVGEAPIYEIEEIEIVGNIYENPELINFSKTY